MNLNDVMSNEEKQAIANLVRARLDMEMALMNLNNAKRNSELAGLKINELVFTRVDGKRTCKIPERFVAQVDGKFYFITIDVDGDNSHTIRELTGVLYE